MSAISAARGQVETGPSFLHSPFAVAAGLSLVLLAFSAWRALPSTPAIGPAAAGPAAQAPSDRIAVVVAGIPAALTPDTVVPIAGQLSARIALDRGADGRGARDLRVSLVDADGRPLDGASITLVGQMRFMDHGAFQAIAWPEGLGRYTAHLLFPMPGEYDVRVNVDGAGSTGSLVLDLELD